MDMDALMKWGAADVIRYPIDDLRISTDKKSPIAKKDDWTWTCTPTIVQR
jgi:hypothetical protein